jgi:adenine-specific DNA-methyltransferase
MNMLYPRLFLAKNLLCDNGAMFISIDDHEIDNLKKLCNEIFGEENFLAQIIWQKIHSTKNDAKYFSDTHEYILVYAKNIESVKVKLLPRTAEMDARFQNPDNDPRGEWSSGDLVANEERKEGRFEVKGPTGAVFNVPEGKHWVYSKLNLLKYVDEGRIWFGKNGDAFPRLKRYLNEVQQGRKCDTIWLADEVGHNQESTKELKAIFDGAGLFQNPKPVRLLTRCVELITENDDIILDFFAGSGSTGQAVIDLNTEDGQKRKFILATNNEKNSNDENSRIPNGICVDVTYPRLKEVIKSDKQALGKANLRYFKTKLVSSKPTDANRHFITRQAIGALCVREECFREVEINDEFHVYSGKSKMLGVLFSPNSIVAFKSFISKHDYPTNVYVFSLGNDDFAEQFVEYKGRVSTVALPKAILNAYYRSQRLVKVNR